MNKIILILILFFIAALGFSDEREQTTNPTAPKPPEKPVVPGASENTGLPKLPPRPAFPNMDNQNNGRVREVANYNLVISEAFPNGNTRNNVANTINNGQYILYSDRTAQLKLSFKNGTEYVYHLRNPRAKLETSAGVFRETFDAIVQVGGQFLLEQYSSELSYDNNSVISFNLIGNGKVIVFLRFAKKT